MAAPEVLVSKSHNFHPVPDSDVIAHILSFCDRHTLAIAARSSRVVNDLATPLLYRHLSLDLSLPNPLINATSTAAPAPNPHLAHTRTLRISAHHRAHCSALSASTATSSPSFILPHLRSLHFQIDRLTYHWPHGCPLIQSLHPAPEELILSADRGCDVLYWTFGSRCWKNLPEGVRSVVFLMKHFPGVGMQEAREWHGGDGGKPRILSSLNRIKEGKYVGGRRREVVLVYDESWALAGGAAGVELELGNIAVLASLVAASVKVYGLVCIDHERVKGEGEMMRLVEEQLRDLAQESGGDQEDGGVEGALARVHFYRSPWPGSLST